MMDERELQTLVDVQLGDWLDRQARRFLGGGVCWWVDVLVGDGRWRLGWVRVTRSRGCGRVGNGYWL